MRHLARVMLLLAPVILLAACERREGPFERAGERIDRGVDRLTR
jgi:hypothetical protein